MASPKPKPLRNQKAIDWLAAKQPVTKEQWDKISWESARRAFMVSGVAKVDVVKAVRDAMVRNAKRGGNLEAFRKMVEPMLRREWQGTVANPAARIGTIYTTNMQSAYMAGRWQAMQRTKASKPYAIFNAVNDERTSQRCLRLDGLVASLDAWERRGYVPPLHFRCRSVLEPLPAKDAKKRGITARLPTVQVNPGFGSVAQADEWKPDLKSYPPDLRKFIKQNEKAAKQAKPATQQPPTVSTRKLPLPAQQAIDKLGAQAFIAKHPIKIQYKNTKLPSNGVYSVDRGVIVIKKNRKDNSFGRKLKPGKTNSVSLAGATMEEATARTATHELMHHIVTVDPKIDAVVQYTWWGGKANPISKVATLNAREYASETVTAYLYEPAKLRKHDPQGYAMAEQIVRRVQDSKFVPVAPKPPKNARNPLGLTPKEEADRITARDIARKQRTITKSPLVVPSPQQRRASGLDETWSQDLDETATKLRMVDWTDGVPSDAAGQKLAREGLRGIIRHNGMASWDGKRRYTDETEEYQDWYEAVTKDGKDKLEVDGTIVGAAHSMCGRIKISQDGSAYLGSAMRKLDWGNLKSKEAWLRSVESLDDNEIIAVQLILHEEVHGASPFKDSIFEDSIKGKRRFFRLGIEEGMTELKSQDITRKLLGPKASE